MPNKILIIDDDEEMCKEMSEILSDEGYSVNMAFDGLAGQRIIETNNYDLLLLDLKMPGINGLEILKTIKAEKIKAKVIILTGSLAVINKEFSDILKLADGVISKPFAVEVVLAKIRELLH